MATFAIDLQNCGSTASGVTVSFSGAADSRNTDLLALTAGESDASGIGIALYDQNKTLIPLGQESDVVTLSPGQRRHICNFMRVILLMAAR